MLGVWLLLTYLPLSVADNMTDKTQLPSRGRALRGREEKMVVAGKHDGDSSADITEVK